MLAVVMLGIGGVDNTVVLMPTFPKPHDFWLPDIYAALAVAISSPVSGMNFEFP